MERKIIHVDMDEFFARVEQLRHSHLMGRPVVVGGSGDPKKRGVVSTASYEARKYGIHSAMPLRTAYRLCPDATFLPVDIPAYRKASESFMAILREYTPFVEPWGLDEAFLDVTHSLRSARTIGGEIKCRIKMELNLVATVGIGPNKLVAKIASSHGKPDGFTVVETEEVEDFLGGLPVRALWGVGPKTESRLKKAGIETVAQLRCRELGELRSTFGDSMGRMLYRCSRGLDEGPVLTRREPKSMSRETTFEVDTLDPERLRRTIEDLSKGVAAHLEGSRYCGRTVTLKIRYDDFSTHTRSTTAAQSIAAWRQIYARAMGLLSKYRLTRKVRLIGVRISGLERSD